MIIESFLGSLSLAQATPVPANDPGGMLRIGGMVVIMFAMMYFIVIRPQKQRQKQLTQLMGALKAGDKVLTNSGIVGVVVGVKDKTVSIRSADSKLEILKTTISEITEKAGAEAAQS